MSRSPSSARRRPLRRLRVEKGMTLLEILIVLAILALVMGLLVGPRILAMFEEGKAGVAKAMARKLAHEAYGQWAMKPGNKGCPTIEELAPLVDQKATLKDPWDNPYVIKCGGDLPGGVRGIAVYSKGEDGRDGTDDDQKSWDE